ncbi:MAG: hypothetical protein FJ288_01715 [Planctomycetes bacterium]|nr:hypothetical protein [Planctomycetota bacterium]
MLARLCRYVPAVLAYLAAAAAAAEPVERPAAMVFPGKDREEAGPASQGVDAARLSAAMEYLAANVGRDGTREAVVIRSGRLIWKGPDIDKVHGVWSAIVQSPRRCRGL